MLEARIEELHAFMPSDGVAQIAGVNKSKIQELAKDGWQLVTTISPRPCPEAIIGVFYRKVRDDEKKADAPAAQPETPAARKPGRPRKNDA